MRNDVAVILMGMGYDSMVDFRATAIGQDDVSVQWLSMQPQPSEADINGAALGVYKTKHIYNNRAECSRRIYARYPAGRQLSALAGLYDSANVATMTDWIAACIAAENAAADAIEAATTVAAVEAVTVAWPA